MEGSIFCISTFRGFRKSIINSFRILSCRRLRNAVFRFSKFPALFAISSFCIVTFAFVISPPIAIIFPNSPLNAFESVRNYASAFNFSISRRSFNIFARSPISLRETWWLIFLDSAWACFQIRHVVSHTIHPVLDCLFRN